jgi:hypothetical protein
MGEGIDEIAVGVFLETFQRYGTTGGIGPNLAKLKNLAK